MVKSPYRSVIDAYPASKLPRELIGGIDPSAEVKIILAVLDDDGQPINRHVFFDREPGEPASPEVIDDYIRWIRGD
jgi:predicted RNase H-like nuclease (RuvC/YqgF family)